MLRRLDKTINFLENYGLKIFTVLLLIILICIVQFFQSDIPLKTFMSYFLEKKESTFITIAAIFIGMYLALFTIFGSIKRDSIISSLSEEDLSKLIKFLRNALIGACFYIFLTLFFTKEYNSLFWNYFNIVLFTTLIYMLLAAFRFVAYIVFVVSDDLSRISDDHKELVAQENHHIELMMKLEDFLNDYEKLNEEEQNKALRQIIRERDNNQDT
ncbi:hypothetical protein P4256_10060 [Bacillus wiedmannii]|uniref:hypothetical protein n=1 Tax=Bacillus wiedmannii TaxID=1890302 RepID=UPI002E22DAC9|nr:hypothetical protein [Bacillus wiedmannii]